MPKAYVRVRQLSQDPGGAHGCGVYKMTIKLTPGSIPLIANFTKSNPPTCNHVYRFDIQTMEKAVFEVCLIESTVFSNIDIARVTLPLTWFPKDKVVQQWFPLKPMKQGSKELLVLCDVHLSFNSDEEFKAPLAGLTVKPCWNVPTYLTYTVCPPYPTQTVTISQPQSYQVTPRFPMGQIPQQMMMGQPVMMANSMMMGQPYNQNPYTGAPMGGQTMVQGQHPQQNWSSQSFFK